MSSAFSLGAFVLSFLLGGLLTLLVGTGLVLLYRHAVRGHMHGTVRNFVRGWAG
jgi:uncharacterized integral membrane protein